MDYGLYTEILISKIEEIKILCDNKNIFQFDNDHKYKSLHAYEFNKK